MSYDHKIVGKYHTAVTDRIRIYHEYMDPFSHQFLLILEAGKVNYEVYLLNPLKIPGWYKSINPSLKSPMIEIPPVLPGGPVTRLFGTYAIFTYLDEKQDALHPRDPYAKAQGHLLLKSFQELIKGSVECFNTNFASGNNTILQTLDILEEKLSSRVNTFHFFFGGEMPGILDYMFWPWVERLHLLKYIDEAIFYEKQLSYPNLSMWAFRMHMDDVVVKYSKPTSEYYYYYRNLKEQRIRLELH